MSVAPICHISTGSTPIRQPRATLLPSVPVAVDLPSAIAAINALKLLVQMIAGQQAVTGPAGVNGRAGLRGAAGGSSVAGAPGDKGQKGDSNGKENDRFVEDRSKRVESKKRIFQDNDKKSENYVDIMQINHVVWVDTVTGGKITWSR